MKNISDYKNAISRMHARPEIDLSAVECGTEKRHISGKRFFPAIAIAVTLAVGTVGVAAAIFEWIRSFFHKDIFISEDVEALVANFDNYECYSNCGIDMSLDGIIADEQSIYCQFTINEAPDGYDLSELSLHTIESESFRLPEGCKGVGAGGSGSVNDEGKFILSCSWDNAYISQSDSIAIHIDNPGHPESGKTVYDQDNNSAPPSRYELMTPENFENCDADYVLIRFDLELGKTTVAEISKEELKTDDIYFGDIKITPFTIICENSATSPLHRNAKVIIKDGREVMSKKYGVRFTGCSYADPEGSDRIVNEGTQIWELDEPINPESITEIYVGDQLIYKK